MNIVIVGCGKVGYTIAKQLSLENDNNITIIDKKMDSFEKIVESIDVLTIKGNALNAKILSEASIETVDLIICVTSSDETNILCCLTAKKLGAKYTIARVRDPEYSLELSRFKKDLGLDMIINPEQQAAQEMLRLIRFPTADNIDTFVDGRIELVSFRINEGNNLANKSLLQLFDKSRYQVLAVAVERNDDIFIPSGSTILKAGDILKVIGKPSYVTDFIKYAGENIMKIKSAMIIGGGEISFYIAAFLIKQNIKVKIIEINKEKCDMLSESLAKCLIINGDGTDEEMLQSENISETDAVICLTDRDEENVIIGMYAKSCGVSKTIIKINHINIGLVQNLNVGSVVCPKNLTANQIIHYVRGLKNSLSSGTILTKQMIISSKTRQIEALEFSVSQPSKCLNIPLKDLPVKKGILVASIVRQGNIIIPIGSTTICDGDDIIIITESGKINKLDDILESVNFFDSFL